MSLKCFLHLFFAKTTKNRGYSSTFETFNFHFFFSVFSQSFQTARQKTPRLTVRPVGSGHFVCVCGVCVEHCNLHHGTVWIFQINCKELPKSFECYPLSLNIDNFVKKQPLEKSALLYISWDVYIRMFMQTDFISEKRRKDAATRNTV